MSLLVIDTDLQLVQSFHELHGVNALRVVCVNSSVELLNAHTSALLVACPRDVVIHFLLETENLLSTVEWTILLGALISIVVLNMISIAGLTVVWLANVLICLDCVACIRLTYVIHVCLRVIIMRLLAIHLIVLGLIIRHSLTMLIWSFLRIANHKSVVCFQLFKADFSSLPEVD